MGVKKWVGLPLASFALASAVRIPEKVFPVHAGDLLARKDVAEDLNAGSVPAGGNELEIWKQTHVDKKGSLHASSAQIPPSFGVAVSLERCHSQRNYYRLLFWRWSSTRTERSLRSNFKTQMREDSYSFMSRKTQTTYRPEIFLINFLGQAQIPLPPLLALI